MNPTWCLHIGGAEELRGELSHTRIATFERSATIQPFITLATQLIAEEFGAIEFTRCYFGNEFCEHLIPTPKWFSMIGAY